MSLIRMLYEAYIGDPPRVRQPAPLEDDEATDIQADLIRENRILKAELRRLGYKDFYVEALIRRGGVRS